MLDFNLELSGCDDKGVMRDLTTSNDEGIDNPGQQFSAKSDCAPR